MNQNEEYLNSGSGKLAVADGNGRRRMAIGFLQGMAVTDPAGGASDNHSLSGTFKIGAKKSSLLGVALNNFRQLKQSIKRKLFPEILVVFLPVGTEFFFEKG